MRKHAFSAAVLTTALLAGGATAATGNPSPGVVVSLGDSYISGEAVRWMGNSPTSSGSRNGTDRAYWGGWYYEWLVYLDGTDADGCHRGDYADVHWSGGTQTINLACSGATTANVFRASQGGQSQNGWAPQADQLAALDPSIDVDAIILSIGGNDLGFADILLDCASDWASSPSWWENHCHPEQQQNVDNRMPQAMADVAKAIDEIDAVMAARGDSDYRLILRSYPSPIPRGSEIRYSESGWSRWDDGGCPFWNEDADWGRDQLVPQISANLAGVAASKGVEFLDIQDLLEDHEVCSIHTSHVGSSGPDSTQHEWVRWMNTGWGQGESQESLHPNAYGQAAAGHCIEAMLLAPVGNYDCTSSTGGHFSNITLSAS